MILVGLSWTAVTSLGGVASVEKNMQSSSPIVCLLGHIHWMVCVQVELVNIITCVKLQLVSGLQAGGLQGFEQTPFLTMQYMINPTVHTFEIYITEHAQYGCFLHTLIAKLYLCLIEWANLKLNI